MSQQELNEDNAVISIAELEEKTRANPADTDLKEELVRALVNRYLYGEDGVQFGNKADIQQARELVNGLSDSSAYYPRAYFAYLDEKDNEAVQWLEKYAAGADPTHPAEPFSAGELYWEIVLPFTGASPVFWSGLAASMATLWPDSPAALIREKGIGVKSLEKGIGVKSLFLSVSR